MDCLVCLDYPPQSAKVFVDGIPTCQFCFDCLSSNLATETLETLISIEN